MNIKYVAVNNLNFKKAIEIQNKIFPNERGDYDILESIGKRKKHYGFVRYYLMYVKNKCVGITGIHSYDIYPDDAWLAWAGIVPEVNQNLFMDCLAFTKNQARELGYKSLRVYSDTILNKDFNHFYKSFGMISEPYTKEDGKFFSIGKTEIYSLSINNTPVKSWDNKNLYLAIHELRNNSINNEEKTIFIDVAKINLVEVTSDIVQKAIKIQHKIFPLENGRGDILESLQDKIKNFNFIKYYLVQHEENFIGITGIFSYANEPKDAWIGWFGLLHEYRGQGVSKIVLNETFNLAKKFGFETLRADADDELNDVACIIYSQFFETKEIYDLEKGKYYCVGKTIIFSKSLTDKPVKLWNNKLLNLARHEKQNNIYNLKYCPLTLNNLEEAAVVQYKIFNSVNNVGYADYKNEVLTKLKTDYPIPLDYLVKYKNTSVGVIGLYEVEGYPKDIWVSWFGVLYDYRKHGFGTQMLQYIFEVAKKLNKDYCRLFTYSVWNASAQGLYKRAMTIEEKYTNSKENPYNIKVGKSTIFSIGLNQKEIPLWNNKFINISQDNMTHAKSIEEMKKDNLFQKYNL